MAYEIERRFLIANDNWKRFIESNDEEYSGGHPTSEHNKILSDKLYEYINA